MKLEKNQKLLSENRIEMCRKPITPNMGYVGPADRITGQDLRVDGPLKKKIVISSEYGEFFLAVLIDTFKLPESL